MQNIKKETHTANSGYTIFDTTDDAQYFVMGKMRIKISEHFSKNGEPLDCLMEDIIRHAAIAS